MFLSDKATLDAIYEVRRNNLFSTARNIRADKGGIS